MELGLGLITFVSFSRSFPSSALPLAAQMMVVRRLAPRRSAPSLPRALPLPPVGRCRSPRPPCRALVPCPRAPLRPLGPSCFCFPCSPGHPSLLASRPLPFFLPPPLLPSPLAFGLGFLPFVSFSRRFPSSDLPLADQMMVVSRLATSR